MDPIQEYLNKIVKCPICGKDVKEGDRIWLDGLATCPNCYKARREQLDNAYNDGYKVGYNKAKDEEQYIKYDNEVTNQIKNTLEYYEQTENIEEIPIDILRSLYKDKIQECKLYQLKLEKLSSINLNNLVNLIDEIEQADKRYSLSDEYLKEENHLTRDEVGIGEMSYGIVMIPVDWILPYLKQLKDLKEE